MLMQGYDVEAAVPFIAAAMRKAGHKLPVEELTAFVRRAIEADMQYMQEYGVLTEDGLMGEDEYDDDDAFEALLDMLADDPEDDEEMDRLAQLLDSYMQAQQDFMDESGLMDA
jgi:hypothetical protein